jgi:hypothetical protein
MNEKQIIKVLYPYIRGPLIAEYLGISASRMYNYVWDNGIRKHPKFRREMNSKLAMEAGERSRFKKGHVPFNKGIKCPNLLQTNAAKTMFKKGNKPFNTREANATSIRIDSSGRKYHYTKIADSKWVLTHRLIWEQANGLIPNRHIVRFLDGNTMNLELSNLECIPMNQNMTKNTIQRFPMELQQVMKLKSKLNKTINNGKKRNERS